MHANKVYLFPLHGRAYMGVWSNEEGYDRHVLVMQGWERVLRTESYIGRRPVRLQSRRGVDWRSMLPS